MVHIKKLPPVLPPEDKPMPNALVEGGEKGGTEPSGAIMDLNDQRIRVVRNLVRRSSNSVG